MLKKFMRKSFLYNVSLSKKNIYIRYTCKKNMQNDLQDRYRKDLREGKECNKSCFLK